MTAASLILSITVPLSLLGLYFALRPIRAQLRAQNSTLEELRSAVTYKNDLLLFGTALQELKRRNEDYSVFEPVLLELLISERKYERKRGLTLLEHYFPETSNTIELNWISPSTDQISAISKRLARRS